MALTPKIQEQIFLYMAGKGLRNVLPLSCSGKHACDLHTLLYTSGLVSLKERLLYTFNKLFVKQVKSFYLLLDPDPFIFLYLLHNTKYIKFTSIQDISIKVIQLSPSLFPSQVISLLCRIHTMFTKFLDIN